MPVVLAMFVAAVLSYLVTSLGMSVDESMGIGFPGPFFFLAAVVSMCIGGYCGRTAAL